jgi:hypothetical protein
VLMKPAHLDWVKRIVGMVEQASEG